MALEAGYEIDFVAMICTWKFKLKFLSTETVKKVLNMKNELGI